MAHTSRIRDRASAAVLSRGCLVVLAALALALALAPSASADDFCANLVASLSGCPSVATADTVDISKYTGRWYGVGASAQQAFAFLGQRGAQCVTANYTALGTNSAGANQIQVLNRALAVTNQLRTGQSAAISRLAGSMGLGLRVFCQFLVGGSAFSVPFPEFKNPLAVRTAIAKAAQPKTSAEAKVKASQSNLASDSALKLMYSITTLPRSQLTLPFSVTWYANRISDLLPFSFLSSATKDKIRTELGNIQDAVDAASAAAGEIFSTLGQIQASNSVLTGSTLPGAYSLRDTVAGMKGQANDIKGLVRQLSSSRAQIKASADIIKKAANSAGLGVGLAAGALNLLASKWAPLGLAVSGLGLSTRGLNRTVHTIRSSPQRKRVVSVNGTAVQSSTKAGALTVSFFQELVSAPYNIIKLDGDAATGYSTALVYTCNQGIQTYISTQNTVFLLSRSPTVSQSVIDNALSFLSNKGIFLGGDNSFVTVSQDSTLCEPITSLE